MVNKILKSEMNGAHALARAILTRWKAVVDNDLESLTEHQPESGKRALEQVRTGEPTAHKRVKRDTQQVCIKVPSRKQDRGVYEGLPDDPALRRQQWLSYCLGERGGVPVCPLHWPTSEI